MPFRDQISAGMDPHEPKPGEVGGEDNPFVLPAEPDSGGTPTARPRPTLGHLLRNLAVILSLAVLSGLAMLAVASQ